MLAFCIVSKDYFSPYQVVAFSPVSYFIHAFLPYRLTLAFVCLLQGCSLFFDYWRCFRAALHRWR